jgi:DNA-binding transcriptional ArsR family regulator
MDIAGAVADPIRREILMLLRTGPMTAGEIAARFSISRPAISRHLRVLRESGLARSEPIGRRQHYTLDTAPLTELRQWLDQFLSPAPLERSLDALETEVRRTRREREQKWPNQPKHELNTEHTA